VTHSAHNRGLAAGVTAFLMWGFVAEYFQLLIDRGVTADVLLAHRVVWSTVFCGLIVALSGGVRPLILLLRDRDRVGRLAVSAVLIAINWLAFIYAIQTNQRTDAVLGYFINPLVSVALAVLIVKERLSPVKWLSVALAAVGVTMIVLASGGRVPWIAATLAGSFAFYGLVRKFTAVEPVLGLTVETALLVPVAIGYLLWNGPADAAEMSPSTYGLLILAGVVTAIPLILFGYAARRLPLGTTGFLQYLAPTCQLLMAVLWRGEPIRHRIGGFVLIWAALLLFSVSGMRRSRRAASGSLSRVPTGEG
jgi:chloramphenicol-sensitive protein RarD